MVELHDVSKVYRTERIETLALDSIDMGVEKGEFVSVMGPSGCGKSTLLNLMGLLDEPTRGKVRLDGERIEGYGDRAVARLRNEKVGFKIREAQLQKVPYMLVVGDREAREGTVSVRNRRHGDLGVRPVEQFIAEARELVERKVTQNENPCCPPPSHQAAVCYTGGSLGSG